MRLMMRPSITLPTYLLSIHQTPCPIDCLCFFAQFQCVINAMDVASQSSRAELNPCYAIGGSSRPEPQISDKLPSLGRSRQGAKYLNSVVCRPDMPLLSAGPVRPFSIFYFLEIFEATVTLRHCLRAGSA
ncbi:hypothetical protein P152DRAFT_2659 [Eremomyces bilateralis CBS 781.70]|uniref:Uncharacterized protein n=1 Tax=Eremomyces bilateralis CBS 781.70 TaxID=1392243 RepID=A0A6G1GFR3_9PEZI|nr:uncharacterized protein P152DRAFT_2659 [Eremomyces bilateralis CBS 781.70]KAF1816864.1 hypothetical protein P152DRAFT_2659 [Eremomyces bilateralis CBS 781.70]